MKLWQAIVLTLCLQVICAVVYLKTGHVINYYMIIGTTLWAAIDSSRIGLKRYRHGIGPVAFFFACLFFWLVGFTWYLWMRHKILTGKAELKTNDPRCVRCDKLINPNLKECPKCGWPQPERI